MASLCVTQLKQTMVLVGAAEEFVRSLQAYKNHREKKVLPKLQEIDNELTKELFVVNTALYKSGAVTAVLAVISAVCMFFDPKVGLALLLVQAFLYWDSRIGKWIAERTNKGSFQEMITSDDANCERFTKATEAFQQELLKPGQNTPEQVDEVRKVLAHELHNMFADHSDATGQAGKAANSVVQCGGVFGGVVAVFSIRDEVDSWETSNNVQDNLRQTITEIEEALERIRRGLQ